MKNVLLATLLALGLSNMAMADDIIDVATHDGSLKTFLTAVKAADLTAKINGAGPITIFAPSDAAFAKLPKDKLEALLKDKVALTALLSYHVVGAKITAADVEAGKVKSLEGHDLKISVADGVKVNDVAVVGGGDLKADNGEIHIIDTVLMPTAEKASKKKTKK